MSLADIVLLAGVLALCFGLVMVLGMLLGVRDVFVFDGGGSGIVL